MAKRFLASLTLATLWLGMTPMIASAQGDLGERLGRELDERFSELSREIKEGWAKVETLVDQLGVRGRVYARVHWDKSLASEAITIEVDDSHVVVLTGHVQSDAHREKAVRLAEDTVGVSQVVDRLQVETKPSPAR